MTLNKPTFKDNNENNSSKNLKKNFSISKIQRFIITKIYDGVLCFFGEV